MLDRDLISDLQSRGLRFSAEPDAVDSRKGGAGPTDHRAITIGERTVMVPVLNGSAAGSPYIAEPDGRDALLFKNGEKIGGISLPARPQFYDLETSEGIPYWKIAQLHSRDVLATTVLQKCYRFTDAETRCQFCAIEDSLRGGRTVGHKTPAMLAEVAKAAKRLDGVTHMVMTTGTPKTPDRGAAILSDCARAVKDSSGLPLQAQCEPPDDYTWFKKMRDSGVDALGMHLEAFDPEVRARIMPGKAELTVEDYHKAYRAAVEVFGWGQVSTYLLAGLGDTVEGLLAGSRELIDMGVYPFVVPFVPVSGTRLESHPSPSAQFMSDVLRPLGRMLADAGMTSDMMKAGCGKCGACSALASFEML